MIIAKTTIITIKPNQFVAIDSITKDILPIANVIVSELVVYVDTAPVVNPFMLTIPTPMTIPTSIKRSTNLYKSLSSIVLKKIKSKGNLFPYDDLTI